MRNAIPEFFADRDASRPESQQIMNLMWVLPVSIFFLLLK
jgi:hypothetical protein